MKKAKKASSRGIFKRPDWDEASTYLKEAVQIYKQAGPMCSEQYVKALKESAKAYQELNSLHTAGDELKKAGEELAKKKSDDKAQKEATECFTSASKLYLANSNIDAAAKVLASAGAMYGEDDVKTALTWYKQACEVLEDHKGDRKMMLPADTFNKAVTFAVKAEQWDAALEYFRSFCAVCEANIDTYQNSLHMNYMAMALIYFAKEDYEGLESEFKNWEQTGNFESSAAWGVVSNLLTAYRGGDEKQLEEALKTQQLSYINPAVARLTRKLKLSEKVVAQNKGSLLDDEDHETPADAAQATDKQAEDLDDLM